MLFREEIDIRDVKLDRSHLCGVELDRSHLVDRSVILQQYRARKRTVSTAETRTLERT